MPVKIAPPCKRCGKPYLQGKSGLCESCRTRQRRGHDPRQCKDRPPKCDCGRPAVAILLVQVGEECQYTARMPVCANCLCLEQESV